MSEAQRKTELKAVGVVTGHISRSSSDNSRTLRYPSVKFQTADGRTIEFQSEVGTNAAPGVGDQVTVFYDPERPEDAKLALGSAFKIKPKMLLIAGAIFLGGMFFLILCLVALVVWATS